MFLKDFFLNSFESSEEPNEAIIGPNKYEAQERELERDPLQRLPFFVIILF